jgi:hypothetical protein
MSCITTGLGTLVINPDDFNSFSLALVVLRDIAFTGWYVVLLYFAFTMEESQCIKDAGLLNWLFVAGIVSLLRLMKNPLQFVANQRIQQNGTGWNNPEDLSKTWYHYFTPQYHICSMRIYALFDWLSYGAWVIGLATVRPTDQCPNNFVVQAGFWEVGISTFVYILSLLVYTSMYSIHRCTRGRLLPGFTIYRQPEGCPGLTFDTSQWRQPGEPLQDYRQRVTRTFELLNYVTSQPMHMQEMTTQQNIHLTREEIQSLKTFAFTKARGTDISKHNESKNSTPINNTAVPQNSIGSNDSELQVEEEKSTDDVCALCIDDYQEKDILRELFCQHRYHAECIDEWFGKGKRTCPVCNGDALGKK